MVIFQILPFSFGNVSVSAVKYLLLLATLALSGCQTFTKISVSDLQGHPISDWVAEGRIKKGNGGYVIKAVERNTPPPYATHNRYPNGRVSTVVGPNMTFEKIDKPEWLKELEVK